MKNNEQKYNTRIATYIHSKEVESNHVGNYMPGIYMTECIGNQSVHKEIIWNMITNPKR